MPAAFDPAAAARALAAAFGGGDFSRAALLRTLRRQLGDENASDAALQPYAHALLRSGVVVAGATLESYRVDRALLQDEPIEGIPEQPLDAVTRRFLEEVLREAVVPATLMDEIVQRYQMRGRIEMSEDGNRYIIRLAPDPA